MKDLILKTSLPQKSVNNAQSAIKEGNQGDA